MNRRIFAELACALCLCCALSLSACTSAPPSENTPAREPAAAPTASPEAERTPAPEASPRLERTPSPTAPPEPERTPAPTSAPEPEQPLTDEEIGRAYAQAIEDMTPSVSVNVAGREWKYGAENDLRNIYYGVLSNDGRLKYAYDIAVELDGGTARCTFSYMPYKTGAYAAGVPAGSHSVGSLHDADVMAQTVLDGRESVSVAITDPSLEVEDLQRALAQGGYGWIACTLSRDGTEILTTPAVGMTLADCAGAINETFEIAGGIIDEVITPEMTDREKAEALYAYVTENVSYDYRYYSDRASMPYASTVALGALRDGVAVCGGYSHAFETLLDMCGIENYTVSGVSGGEYHAWNYVVLDGEGWYCDPTADRGGARGHFLVTADGLESLGSYEWDEQLYPRLRR